MSVFRTTLKLSAFPFSISHEDKILSLGSCFAENIGQKLEALKFSIVLNPFGILYNPISIQKGLEVLLGTKKWEAQQLFFHKGLWRSFLFHSQMAHPNKEEAIRKMELNIEKGQQQLMNADVLLLTLGTAFVHVFQSSGEVVANCHKRPAADFVKRKLQVEEIVQGLGEILKKLKQELPHLKIITTISPVRHIKEGLVENQRSKAVLLLALEQLCQEVEDTYYFPSYELLLDDLRDYRFFGKDMIHPNETAIDYIWQKFDEAFFNEKTRQLNRRINAINQARQHKAFYPESKEHQLFLGKQLEKIKQLETEFSFLNFEKERRHFGTMKR